METALTIGNARSTFQGLPDEVFRALRYELSYRVADPGQRVYMQPDGSAKTVFWDGFTCLLRPKGWMPTGLVPRALRLLRKWQVPLTVEDKRQRPVEGVPRWSLPSGFELRPYQRTAVEAAWSAGRGVIDSPPRTGKTMMITELVRLVTDMTVITSPTIQIAKQTYERLLTLLAHGEGWSSLGDPARDFFILTGGPPKGRPELIAANRAMVFVGTVDTALAMPESWWEKVACLIVDERHHQAAKSYHTMNDLACNAYYRWGFTGTNYRSDGEFLALEAVLGETVKSFTIREMTAAGVLVPARVQFWVMDLSRRIGGRAKFDEAYVRGVVRCDERNGLVVAAAAQLMAQGRRVLILVERIEHGERLAALIPGSVFVQGSDGDRIREATADLDSGQLRCVIGSPVVGEGLDIPSADAVVYAKGKKARVTHTQAIFRVLTGDGRKKDAVIIDFADRHSPALLEHAVERMRNYAEMGCRVEVLDNLRTGEVQGQTGFGP